MEIALIVVVPKHQNDVSREGIIYSKVRVAGVTLKNLFSQQVNHKLTMIDLSFKTEAQRY